MSFNFVFKYSFRESLIAKRMKKSIAFLFLSFYLSASYGQETLFLETCGDKDVSSPKKVDSYTGWDNSNTITFSRTTSLDGYADVRTTSGSTNHIWFPSGKNTDLVISKIAANNHKNLKLSFDIAAYKLADANVNKLSVYSNNCALVIPSVTFLSSKFITISNIPIPNTDSIVLKFEYTALNNTNGYRLDNLIVKGEKVISDANALKLKDRTPFFCGKDLIFPSSVDATPVVIYNTVGIAILSSRLNHETLRLDGNLPKGIYIVRVSGYTWKILL